MMHQRTDSNQGLRIVAWRRGSAVLIRFLLVALTGAAFTSHAAAYEPDEARAILVQRPDRPPPGSRRVVIAEQRIVEVAGAGEMMTHDHILWMAGPALEDASTRWTFRPGVEDVRMREGWIHRANGTSEPIPRDSARVEACRAAGPGGYPGVGDYVVHAPVPAPGDVVEIRLDAIHRAMWHAEHYAGEIAFAGADSIIETQFILRTPLDFAARVWWLGAVPEPREVLHGSSQESQWLLGHLSGGTNVERTVLSVLPVQPADTLGTPILRYAFATTWDRSVLARRRIWRMCLRATPDTLVAVAQTLASRTEERETRLDQALAWEHRRIRPVAIPSARGWFEPEDLQKVVDRGCAIPRDRAALLTWLLRRLGTTVDAVTVSSSGPMSSELVFPQQLDAWVLWIHPPGAPERWIDLREPASRSEPLPPGQAIVWTGADEDPVVVPFPGLSEGP